MDRQTGRIHSVAWTEVLPWLCLLRTFRPAASLRALSIAAVGIALTYVGWFGLGYLFPVENADGQSVARQEAFEPSKILVTTMFEADYASRARYCPLAAMVEAWPELTESFHRITNQSAADQSSSGLAYWGLGGLWKLLVWGFFGVLLCRAAAVNLTIKERLSTRSLCSFAKSKWFSCSSAPILILCAVAVIAIPLAILGLFLRTSVTAWLTVLLLPVVVVGAFVIAILLLGLVFGWPLMWASISTEGTDSFDALSRTYAYLFQRPLQYAGYAIVALLFGMLGIVFVNLFAELVISVSFWALSLGDPALGSKLIIPAGNGATFSVYSLLILAAILVKFLGLSFAVSYFWTAVTAIYLLLRRDTDAIELEEIYLEDRPEVAETLPAPASTEEEAE